SPTMAEAPTLPVVAPPSIPPRVSPRSWPPATPPTPPRTLLSIGPRLLALFSIPPTLPPTAPETSWMRMEVKSMEEAPGRGGWGTGNGEWGTGPADPLPSPKFRPGTPAARVLRGFPVKISIQLDILMAGKRGRSPFPPPPRSPTPGARMPAARTPKRLDFFERYLTVWVGACMVAGVALGNAFPDATAALARWQFGTDSHVNVAIAVLIWLMIYPMMLRVDFS